MSLAQKMHVKAVQVPANAVLEMPVPFTFVRVLEGVGLKIESETLSAEVWDRGLSYRTPQTVEIRDGVAVPSRVVDRGFRLINTTAAAVSATIAYGVGEFEDSRLNVVGGAISTTPEAVAGTSLEVWGGEVASGATASLTKPTATQQLLAFSFIMQNPNIEFNLGVMQYVRLQIGSTNMRRYTSQENGMVWLPRPIARGSGAAWSITNDLSQPVAYSLVVENI